MSNYQLNQIILAIMTIASVIVGQYTNYIPMYVIALLLGCILLVRMDCDGNSDE